MSGIKPGGVALLLLIVFGPGAVIYGLTKKDPPQRRVLQPLDDRESARAIATVANMRTAPGNWSIRGWGELRWGMGPGDVLRTFSEDDALLTDNESWTSEFGIKGLLYRPKDPMFGTNVDVLLLFSDDDYGLRYVSLTPERTLTDEERKVWVRSARAALRSKYGAPIEAPRGNIWIAKGVGEILLLPGRGADGPHITYEHMPELDAL